MEVVERSAAAVDPKKSGASGKENSKAGQQPVSSVKAAAASNCKLVAAAATRRIEGSRQTKVPKKLGE